MPPGGVLGAQPAADQADDRLGRRGQRPVRGIGRRADGDLRTEGEPEPALRPGRADLQRGGDRALLVAAADEADHERGRAGEHVEHRPATLPGMEPAGSKASRTSHPCWASSLSRIPPKISMPTGNGRNQVNEALPRVSAGSSASALTSRSSESRKPAAWAGPSSAFQRSQTRWLNLV